MSSRNYWRKREDEALAKYQKSEAEYDKEIERIYRDMLDGCEREINAFYGRYADKEGISISEAIKRVRKLDIEAYERKAARYVKEKDFSPKANEEMRLYNLTMKVNRLEMLKANIGLELIKGHDELEKFMGDVLKGRTEEELKRQAGILGKTIRNNSQLAHAIPNASFHNATFSDRVWLYQDMMKADLAKMLKTGLIQGKNPRVLARELERYVMGDAKGGAKFNAERLMRTELARVQTEAQKQSFEKNGFTEYEFIANSDCCGICKGLDGKHFKVSKMMPSENAAPMHPHCRCSVAAYEDSEEYEAWLGYLDKGGTTKEWNELKAEATEQAGRLIAKAKEKDKAITADLEKAVAQGSGHLEGLDFRIKGQKSLVRKLISKASQKGISVEQYAEKVTDVLRYTNVSTTENLTEDYFKIVDNMQKKSYTVVEIINTFSSNGPYKGINTLLADGTGYVFELQFHTPESVAVKELNHKLYEEQRLDSTSAERKEKLTTEMIQNAASIPIPKNIEEIKERRG